MYINKIHIQNYRNYSDFTMNFHKGLNVIIGSNNSGKTGLLYAINLLNSPSSISVDDFNKNNLLKYGELYAENAPEIVIEYYISHRIAEDDTSDESIIRLLPFLGIKEFEENRTEKDGKVEYNIAAKIKAAFSLDVKYLDDYRKEFKSVNNFDEFFMMLNFCRSGNKKDIDGRSRKVIDKYLKAYNERVDGNPENSKLYEKIIFSELFLHYAKSKKGEVALSLLTDKALYNEDETTKIVVPDYIQEGLKWLMQ